MTTNISFMTPVKSNNSFISAVEGYLTLSNSRAVVVDGSEHLVEKHLVKTSWATSALKVASWILTLGILPLIGLCIKAAHRCTHNYHYSASDTFMIATMDLGKKLGIHDLARAEGRAEFMAKNAIVEENLESMNPQQMMNLVTLGMRAAQELNLIGVLPLIQNGGSPNKEQLDAFFVANPQFAQKALEIVMRAAELSVIEGMVPSKFSTLVELIVNNSQLLEIPLSTFIQNRNEPRPNIILANLLNRLATPEHVQACLRIVEEVINLIPQDCLPPFENLNLSEMLTTAQRNSNLIVDGLNRAATIIRNDVENDVEADPLETIGTTLMNNIMPLMLNCRAM